MNMAKKTEQEKYAELMEMKTNKAAKQIVSVITSSELNPTASIVSIVKATAILLESFQAVGEDAAYLEMILKNTIGPARQEVRETLLPGLGKDGTGN
jgi:hypothetical protein